MPCGAPFDAKPAGNESVGLPLKLNGALKRMKGATSGVIGPLAGEEVLCQAGAAYERATEWHLRRPPLE